MQREPSRSVMIRRNPGQQRELTLHFGAMVKPIADQLAEQGFTAPARVVEGAQQDVEALNRLYIRSVITHPQLKEARHRVWARLASHTDLRDVERGGDA